MSPLCKLSHHERIRIAYKQRLPKDPEIPEIESFTIEETVTNTDVNNTILNKIVSSMSSSTSKKPKIFPTTHSSRIQKSILPNNSVKNLKLNFCLFIMSISLIFHQ